ncbi:MAG: PEP-CTERM sorting domain-containing protein [Chroococcus sp. CMT-3BRIN-NPC107]|jgi:probable HAF family extracellular repeat protein|nr:PEP-CTERM sorting domain-containing protein [Chroococcus sp. CMT-3BRIN-NPC107]
MFSVKQLSLATVGTVALGLGSIAPVSAASLYEITGLDFLPSDINDSAQVVGENYLWENGNVTDLNTLAGANKSHLFATSINNNGAIVGGGLTTSNSIGQAFVFNGSTISAVTPAFNCRSNCGYVVAEDINDSGTIALNYDGRVGLVQTSYGTTTQALSTRTLFNIAINNQNQVVGSAVFTDGSSLGQFSENGQQTDLVAQAEPDSIYRLNRSTANDINDAGNIVGSGLVSTFPSNSALEATLWTDADEPGVSLGTLGGANSEAFGVNNSEQVVGVSTLLDGLTQHAFLWEGDEILDLNSLIDPALGWELTSAFEINNSGDIIGIGFYNGVESGFIAKAVPEPSSVLGVLGLGAFGLSNWLKRKK